MDFAIDQPVADPPMAAVSADRHGRSSDPSPADVLIAAKPVRLCGSIPERNRVAVYVTDLLERDGQIFIRYNIRNQTDTPYVLRDPQVIALNTPHFRESLYSLANSQLSSNQAARLKSSGETNIEVAKGEIRSARIEPGQETAGIVAIKLPPGHPEHTVLRLVFLAGPAGPISATLVL